MNDRPHPAARSQALFEEFPGCPNVPQMPLQALDHPAALKSLRVADRPLARRLLRMAFLATGFVRFHSRLAGRLDRVVEATNQIVAIGPTVAATTAVVDAPSVGDPFVRAAALLKACWDLHATIRAGQFPPDVHKGHPLEMRQYLNLFGTSTVFDEGIFRLSKTGDLSRVLVLARETPYVVDFGPEPASTSTGAIAHTLNAVWSRATVESPRSSPGALGRLSAATLELQAEGFGAGVEDPANLKSYEAITNTFVTLCLDLEHTPRTYAEAALIAHSGNCANRWFHASVQLVIFANAKAAVICDFNAGLGGNTMVRAAAEIHRRSLAWTAPTTGGPTSEPARIEEVRWDSARVSDERLQEDLNQVLDSQQATFELIGHGRASFSAAGLEPVPAFAIAIQLAVHRLTGRFARIRQFVTVAQYRAQNVALALVSTAEMAELVQALAQPPHDPVRVRRLLHAALESQRKEYRETRSSMPVAASLNLFRAVQEGMRGRYVELVLDQTFKLLRRLKLQEPPPSTDVALSYPGLFPEVAIMGRPGVRLPYVNCFGLHYQIWEDRIVLTVMPSTRWTISNPDLVAELDACLHVVRGLSSGTVPAGDR